MKIKDEIKELHKAMVEVGIWPKEITWRLWHNSGEPDLCYRDWLNEKPVDAVMIDEHTTILMRGISEAWLKKHEDELVYCPREQAYISLFHGNDVMAETLPEALRYAHKNGEIEQ